MGMPWRLCQRPARSSLPLFGQKGGCVRRRCLRIVDVRKERTCAHVGSRSMKKRKLGQCRCYPAHTKLMARTMAKRIKQRSGLEPAGSTRAPPRGTWPQSTGVASARGVWHYPSRKDIWRLRRKFRRNGNRLTLGMMRDDC